MPSDRVSRPLLLAALAGLVVLGAMVLLQTPRADAKQKFMSGFGEAFPAAAGSSLDSCVLCHTDPARPREENLNQFGEDWEDGDLGDKDYLATALLNRDSDGDGVTNGAEIQQLSMPGDPSSSAPPTTTTTVPGTPPDGQALYTNRCAACHGPDGGDLSGTGLARPAFITITIDGQGGMPAQSNLTDQQAGAIWDYVTGTVPATTTVPGATTTTTVPRSGAAVYAASCAMCHGTEAANLRGHDLSLSQVISITTNGVGTMGGYAGTLSPAEIDNVSRYVESFGAVSGVTTTTVSPGSPASGSTLYMQNCSGCHGLHGEGGPGGAVAGTFLSRSAIISLTEAGTSGMPAYGSQLTAMEIAAIADHILGMTRDSAATTVPAGGTETAARPPSALTEGQALFEQYCAGCHGATGAGGSGGAVAGIEISPADLNEAIRDGVGSMPGFATAMTEAELTDLIAFSEALAADPDLMVPDRTTATEAERADESILASDATTLRGLPADPGEPAGGGFSVSVLAAVFLGIAAAGGAVFAWMRSVRNLVS
jgi:mono/diheme cytochrome c family protein